MKSLIFSKAICIVFFILFCESAISQIPDLLYYRFNTSGSYVPNEATSPPSGADTAVFGGSMAQGGNGACGLGGTLIGTGTTTNPDYLETKWNISLSGSWTISFWSANIPLTTTQGYAFFSGGNGIRCLTGGVAGAGNWLVRGVINDVLIPGGASVTPSVTTIVYDKSQSKIFAYLNGTLVDTVTQSHVNIAGTGGFFLGGNNSSFNGFIANGKIDEFRLYGRALSATEVAQLSYVNNSSNTIAAIGCGNSYKSPSGKYTWTTAGTYKDTIPNYCNCDSVLTVNLTFLSNSFNTINPVVCDTYTSPSGKKTWTNTGTYIDTLYGSNANGCDSIITINLIVNKKSAVFVTRVACNSYTSPSGKYTWTTSGKYADTLKTSAGCDSIVTITLTINNSSTSAISPVACNNYTSPSGKYMWASSGNYVDTIPNGAGCDSIISIALTVNYPSVSSISATSCDSYTSPSGKRKWTATGSYVDTIANAVGCDSIITINLTIKNSSTGTLSPVVCGSYTGPSGNHTWTTTGVYTDTLANAVGCDSVITINLTVKKNSNSSIAPTACTNYTSPGGKVFTVSGTYTDTIPNGAGCDSIITINLIIKNKTAGTISPTACGSYTAPSGKVFTLSGAYTDTIPNKAGCDSIITINLTVNKIDITVSQVSFILSSNEANAAGYQWLDCAKNYAAISGETNQTFAVTTNGEYAVKITANNCSDTSACIVVANVGIGKIAASNGIVLYPNPTEGLITIGFQQAVENTTIRVINIAGQIVVEKTRVEGNSTTLDISGEAAGIYFIEVAEKGTTTRMKIVKF